MIKLGQPFTYSYCSVLHNCDAISVRIDDLVKGPTLWRLVSNFHPLFCEHRTILCENSSPIAFSDVKLQLLKVGICVETWFCQIRSHLCNTIYIKNLKRTFHGGFRLYSLQKLSSTHEARFHDMPIILTFWVYITKKHNVKIICFPLSIPIYLFWNQPTVHLQKMTEYKNNKKSKQENAPNNNPSTTNKHITNSLSNALILCQHFKQNSIKIIYIIISNNYSKFFVETEAL